MRYSLRYLLIAFICVAGLLAIASRFARRGLDRYEPLFVIVTLSHDNDVFWSHNGGPFLPLPAIIPVPSQSAHTTAVSHPSLGKTWCVDYGTRQLAEGNALVWALNGRDECRYVPSQEVAAFHASDTVTFVRRGSDRPLFLEKIDLFLCSPGLEKTRGLLPRDHPAVDYTNPATVFRVRFKPAAEVE